MRVACVAYVPVFGSVDRFVDPDFLLSLFSLSAINLLKM